MAKESRRRRSKPHELDAVIRREVERQGLSQYRLAKISGVSQSQVQRFLSGGHSLTLKTASKICRALGLGLVLLDEDGD